jgi:hypothetical protein
MTHTIVVLGDGETFMDIEGAVVAQVTEKGLDKLFDGFRVDELESGDLVGVDLIEDIIKDGAGRVSWLLKKYGLYSEDGHFMFPDGECWHREDDETQGGLGV